MGDRPIRLCIISREGLRTGDFITVLQASLSPEDRLDIITDRRHRGSSGVPDLQVDRRQLLQVDVALEADGFAIVPTSVDRTADTTLPPSESAIDHPSPEEEEELVEGGRNFRRRLSNAVSPILGISSGLTMAALVLILAGWITGQSLISQLFMGPSWRDPGQPDGQPDGSFTAGQSLPAVSETPTAAETPRENGDGLTSRQRQTSRPSEVTDVARRATPGDTAPRREEAGSAPRVASAPSDETGAPPKAGTDQSASGGRPRLSATERPASTSSTPSKQVAGALSAEAAPSNATPAEKPYRAVRVGEPVSRGWGDSYAVRLVNSAGQPSQVSTVLLVAHMADGSVENIAMGALPEPGMYRATVPTARSTPVDLRVRVSAGDRFVEIPVTP